MAIVKLTALVLADGTQIPLSPKSVVVFVGANNSGKSAALRAIRSLLSGPSQSTGSVIMGLVIERGATLEELVSFLEPYRTADNAQNYQIEEASFPAHLLSNYWQDYGIGPISSAVVSVLTTEARLGDCVPPQNIDLSSRKPTHPFQRMMADRALENATSDVVRKAFKSELVIDRGAGGVIPAYIGDRPKLRKSEERGDLSYSQRVRALAPLQAQGDGIRSFVSIIARALTEARPIFLIDEPEAFLHPPQARLVARHLAAENRAAQTFIATHSSDVLQGVLSAAKSVPITVVRLTRSAGSATAVSLDPIRIAELWRDPILRFSNILNGLFHDGVVVTESDADCRFYEAMVDVVGGPDARPDIHYCYSGGKDRLHVVIRSLAELGLPVATVVDFDVLNDGPTLRRIFEAAGGLWASVEADWNIVKTAVESRSGFLAADAFAVEVRAQLKLCKRGDAVPREVLSKVRKLTRQASPWDFCKSAGMSAVPPGNPHVAANRLLGELKKAGLFVVPVGEIEGFKRSIGSHGPRWVEEALKVDVSSDPELSEARAFATEIVGHFK